jgi:alanine racemase
MIIRPTIAKINLKALLHNYHYLYDLTESLSRHKKKPFFCPMVKANAYGHDLKLISMALSSLNPSALGVGLVEEALQIRDWGITTPLLFFGALNQEALSMIEDHRITPVVGSWDQFHRIKEQAFKAGTQSFKIHIKIDTGMHRFGFHPQELESLGYSLEEVSQNLEVVGVMTHLASGEDFTAGQGSFSFQQIKKFIEGLNRLKRYLTLDKVELHIFNTLGLMSFQQEKELGSSLFSFGSRPGIGLYGYTPGYTPQYIAESPLQPVLTLVSHIVHLLWVEKGESVSYGQGWVAPKKSLIGVIPMGYGDGLPRSLSNQAEFLIKGIRVPLVGRVTMDSIMVDVTPLAESLQIKSKGSFHHLLGTEVTLLGSDKEGNTVSLSQWSQWAQTIEWEILTGISARVPRIIHREEEKPL